jgi:tetratricopeptide (TPR) repeat protein
VLAIEPRQADALNLLGLVARQKGEFTAAVEHLRAALAIDATQAAFSANLAEAYRGLGQIDQAIAAYEQAIRLQPSAAVAHVQLGTLYEQAGQLLRAAESYQRATQLDPRRAEAWAGLGLLYKTHGQLAAAEECLRRACELQADAAPVHFELGNVYQMLGRMDDAMGCYRRALSVQPDFAAAACNLGNALRERGALAEAQQQLERAVALRPDLAAAQSNLGAVLQDLGRLDESQACFERALALEPRRAEFLLNLGTVLKDQGRVEEALPWYERALQSQPGYSQALCSRGTAQLSLGRFREGWAGYEHRVGCSQFNTLKFPQPLWDGSPVAPRRLLIHCEQGFGDTLQFIRYVPMVRAVVPEAMVAAQPELLPLVEDSGFGRLIAKEGPLPAFDVHAPLMSLPRIFGTELETVPRDVPYLKAKPDRVARWHEELAVYPGLRIGIAWQGRRAFRGDVLRSIPLASFAPLAAVGGARLLSLQKGPGSEQVQALQGRFEVIDLAARLDNSGGAFLDTAAVMENLDLVITSDTAIAHLAGGLGVRVWVALAFAPDWRWMVGRDDSPWYPTMRLFRQRAPGDWSGVFERMAAELRALAE